MKLGFYGCRQPVDYPFLTSLPFDGYLGVFQINRLILTDFRNYTARSFDFSDRVIAICGDNGQGKTNLLDAIYYLSFTRSAFSRTDASSVRQGAPGFRLEGWWEKEDSIHQIACVLRENGKKEISVDQVPLTRFSGHIGQFPVVMIAPDDQTLITGGSAERRRFLDTLIAQIDPAYLVQLIDYNQVLSQRNSLLKQSGAHAGSDPALLDVFDLQLVPLATEIFRLRSAFCEKLVPLIAETYQELTEGRETVSLSYSSQLQETGMKELLDRERQRDMILQRTGAGIHRDDLLARLGDFEFKVVASQGQRKSLLLACKLAEYRLIREKKSFAPVLLLDDIFEKLDPQRVTRLLQWVAGKGAGQVFLTDTHCTRMADSLKEIGMAFQQIRIA